MDSIESALAFIVGIDKLKNVYRKTRPVGFNRYENAAGHSWREYNISKEQVFAVTSRIAKGSEKIWAVLEPKLEETTKVLIEGGVQ